MTIERKYGCRPDTVDQRDRMFVAAPVDASTLPPVFSLSEWAPPVLDQSSIGSCTAHGITAAMRLALVKEGGTDFPMARLQLYFDERFMEDTVASDAGAEIRDGFKTASSKGVAHEDLWPYDVTKFTVAPPQNIYDDAVKNLITQYRRVEIDTNSVKQAIAQGHPVVIGITLYESFESNEVARTGIVPMPLITEKTLGGHCMCVIGYGEKEGYFTVRNSWGEGWGDKGNCYIPYDYIGNKYLGADYWTVEVVSK